MEKLQQYLELGGIAGLFALFIVQYFNTQKAKKDPMNGTGKAILDELQKQNGNHLEHLQSGMDNMTHCINQGNKEVVDAIHAMHIDIIKEMRK